MTSEKGTENLVPKNSTFDQLMTSLRNTFSLQHASHAKFRTLLGITVVCNSISIVFELATLFYEPNEFRMVMGIMAMILAAFNILIIVKLIVKPTARSSLVACGFIVALELLYVIQTIEYFSMTGDDWAPLISFVICALVTQLVTAYILYRHWEFVLYDYDGNANDSIVDGDPTRFSEMSRMSKV